MDAQFKRQLISDCVAVVITHADELTDLDQAIGDGDHGLNMKRGFEAIHADMDKLIALTWPEFLKAVGTILVMKVGGASGPLYGTLFLSMAKEIGDGPDVASARAAFASAFEAVKARGKSDIGQKTLLDVMSSVLMAWTDEVEDIASVISQRATEAAEATIPMKAIRGRASFLGDRSIGHMDPGARSLSLLIATVAKRFGA